MCVTLSIHSLQFYVLFPAYFLEHECVVGPLLFDSLEAPHLHVIHQTPEAIFDGSATFVSSISVTFFIAQQPAAPFFKDPLCP